MRSSLVLAALLIVTAGAPARAEMGGMIDRFGPDGLPFTWDDPLHVGAHSSPARFGALAADACSEEPAPWGVNARAAHGHGNAHPPTSETDTEGLDGKHVSRPNPASFANPSAFVTDAPFDTTMWVVATNLGSGQTGRFRAFPEDDWLDEIDMQADNRGWVGGWTADDTDMDQVVSGTVKNVHVANLGLAYRDVKQQRGFGVAVKWPTVDVFPEFRDKMQDKVVRIDLMAQEAYVEAYITELQNLDNKEAGVSGRFVLDLAGLQINAHMDKFYKKQFPCDAELDPYYVQLGGPVNTIATGYDTVVDYFLATKWPAIWDNVDLNFLGIGTGTCNAFKGIAEGIAIDKVKEKLQPMDDVATYVDLDEYQVIGLYSGLAGRNEKNPFDRVALGTLKEFGQFRAAEWQRWAHIDEGQALIGFEDVLSPDDMITAEEAFGAQNDDDAGSWRYNNGSSYIDKAMMIFGNSGGWDDDGDSPRPAGPDVDANLRETADILETYAKEWLYVRMDVVDPYKEDEERGVAVWKETDLLFPKAPQDEIHVDWPPPNYGFGSGQVISFRAASGGVPNFSGANLIVEPDSALVWKGLVCVDPITATYSVAGALFKADDPSTVWFFGENAGGPIGDGSMAGWSEPRSLGGGFPFYLENTSTNRWLTAGANHWYEGDSKIRWGWDFDSADGTGAMDSMHAQHMSDVGGSEFGAVFAYQTTTSDGAKGRTGFAMVSQQGSLP